MGAKTLEFNTGFVKVEDFLLDTKLASSKGEAKRLLKAGAVRYRGFERGGLIISDTNEKLEYGDHVGHGCIVQVGRNFRQAKFPDAPVIGLQVFEEVSDASGKSSTTGGSSFSTSSEKGGD